MSIGGVDALVHREYLQLMLFGFSVMLRELFEMLKTTEMSILFKGGERSSYADSHFKCLKFMLFMTVLVIVVVATTTILINAYVRARKNLTFQSTSYNASTS